MNKKDSQPVSVRFEKEHILRLKTLARAKSAQEDRDISYVDLIREAVRKIYFENTK